MSRCCSLAHGQQAAATPRLRTGAAVSAQSLRLLAPPRQRCRPRHRWAASVCAAQKQVFHSFDDLIQKSEVPVLVDFYATWCGPCQMQSQILDQVAPELRGRCKFVKVDSEKYSELASRYSVGALPTLVLFKNGRPVDRVEGVLMADQLKQRLQYFLSNS